MSELIVSDAEDYEERLTMIQSLLAQLTIPIFRKNKKSSRIDVCATGFCLQVNKQIYVITASHSIEDDGEYLIGINGHTKEISGFTRTQGGSKRNRSLDIAAVPINTGSDLFQEVERVATPIESTMYRRQFNSIDIQYVQGFAKKINKSPKNYNSATKCLDASVFGFANQFDEFCDLAHYGKELDTHYAIKWPDKVDGNRVMSPIGLSGAGYWFFPDRYNLERKFLAGVFIEYHKNDSVAFVTKIDSVVKLIESIETAKQVL